MKNSTQKISSELAETLSSKSLKTATFSNGGKFYTFAPEMSSSDFLDRFPDHIRLYGLLDSSGSSWSEKAFGFFLADCFDPPLYVQFGSSYEDAYESFCDNHPDLLINDADLGDYGFTKDEDGGWRASDSITCSFNSEGQPIDTDNLQSFGELTLEMLSF